MTTIHDVLLTIAFYAAAGWAAMWDMIVGWAYAIVNSLIGIVRAGMALGALAPIVAGKILGQRLARRLRL